MATQVIIKEKARKQYQEFSISDISYFTAQKTQVNPSHSIQALCCSEAVAQSERIADVWFNICNATVLRVIKGGRIDEFQAHKHKPEDKLMYLKGKNFYDSLKATPVLWLAKRSPF